MSAGNPIQKTSGAKWVIAPRVIAGGMLLMFGAMHLFSPDAKMLPILEAANMPMPEVGAIVGPIVELIAALLLLSGGFARVGALLATLTMITALASHIRGDWPNEPPIFMPFIVMIPALVVLLVGGGKWSLDAKMTGSKKPDGVE